MVCRLLVFMSVYYISVAWRLIHDEEVNMMPTKWWVKRCPKCGIWLQARPAKDYWTKQPDEEEVEFERTPHWYGGLRWSIGDTLTRIVNVYHDDIICRIEQENKKKKET
jgi:hypothetical protein